MTPQTEQLKSLIDSAKKILITSHISPDPDAVASVLLLGTTLKLNYQDKNIIMVLEEEPEGLDFLTSYGDIKFGNLLETLKQSKPDLFIMLDAVSYERCSRVDGEKIRQYLKGNNIKTVIIDHHEPAGKDETDVYIYQGSIATVQDVYEISFDHLSLKKPEGYGEITMLGIYTDSGGFTYANSRRTVTFKIINELLDQGVNLEAIKISLNHYSEAQMKVLAEFAKNVTSDGNYSYSYLPDEFMHKWQEIGNSMASLNIVAGLFANEFIRNIEDRKWGFIVYLNPLAGANMYAASLRSQSDVKDVAQIASKLGGGGHKPAAGAKVHAKSVSQAIQKVQQAITAT